MTIGLPVMTFVSGCPGSGKTTLAATLAAHHAAGVHLHTDDFYHYMAHPIDPSTPASRAQNTAVVRAFLKAAASFRDDGYHVYVDGVIGPWWFDEIRAVFPDFDYILLHASLDRVLARTTARSRTRQPSANPEVVRTMHTQFDRLEGLDRHTINTDDKAPTAIEAECLERLPRGDFSYECHP